MAHGGIGWNGWEQTQIEYESDIISWRVGHNPDS